MYGLKANPVHPFRAHVYPDVQELQLKLGLEQGYIQRNAKQARAITESNEKLFALEKTLQGMVEDFEKEREYMRAQWTKATDQMQRDVSGYKRIVEVCCLHC